jgi:hypothetical protein
MTSSDSLTLREATLAKIIFNLLIETTYAQIAEEGNTTWMQKLFAHSRRQMLLNNVVNRQL